MEDKDYKKLYEEAVERAKYALTTDMDNSGHWAVNYIFPQLNENKDEKIRKALIHLVKSNKEGSFGIDNYDGIKWDDILSWIEIQEEHKHFRDCIQTGDEVTRNQDGDIVNLSQLKRIAKPKFKIGDWVIVQDKTPSQIEKVTELPNNHYQYWTTDGYWFGDVTVVRLWTIQDAKNGDVLKEDSCIFIIERMKPDGTAIVHCCLFDDGDFDLVGSTLSFDVDSTYPATKEQRELLFTKMKEAGYEWNTEKKELKKIEQESTWNEKIKGLNELETYILSLVPDMSLDAIKVDAKNIRYIINKEKKPSWSEDDENMWLQVISEMKAIKSNSSTIFEKNIAQDKIDWLKSLKDRIQPQPKQEWSEDDESMLTRCIGILGKCYMGELPTKVEEELEWLKSIEPNHWKPSEEQMEALFEAKLASIKNREYFLGLLYEDLKKL